DLVDVLPQAFRIAEAGRPGPVVIDVPKDVQSERIRLCALPRATHSPAAATADVARIAQAAAAIDAAQRPLLYVGGGARHPRAQAQLRRLAERAQLPTAGTLMALGALPADHAL